jgi:hypothetical protein
MSEKLLRNLILVGWIVLISGLLLVGMIYAAENPRPTEHGAVVTLYDDGSVRVVERAGDVLCYQNGHAVDCISRGLKKR